MKLFNKKNIVVGVIALAIGVSAVFGIGKVSGIAKVFGFSNESVTGNVTSFILNPEGKPDGAILSTGDQVHFGAETGAIVSQQIKIGDALTATGKGGYKTSYGREFRAETLQMGGNTITIVHAKPGPPHGEKQPEDEKGPKGKRPLPTGPEAGPRPNAEKPVPPAPDASAPRPNGENPAAENAPPPPAPHETVSAKGNVRFVLVGGRGEVRGLILSDGTQLMLPKEVDDANLAFNEQTSVSADGEAAKGEFGVFIRPVRLTIGDQTFSFNR